MTENAWDDRAEAYRTSVTHATGDDLEAVIELCNPQPGLKVLDVATGGGHVARRLREHGVTVVTADASPGMQPDVLTRAEQLPFEDGSFDLITCVRSLHHIESPTRALDEMARVTAPGGRVVIEDFLADPDRATARRWERVERLRDPGHQRLLESGEARSRLLAAGFTVDAEESWVETMDTGDWIELAGCDQQLAAGIREAVGAPEFQITVGRARFRRPGG